LALNDLSVKSGPMNFCAFHTTCVMEMAIPCSRFLNSQYGVGPAQL
jgi:hypothetical protein